MIQVTWRRRDTRYPRWSVAFATGVSLLAGCATNPVTGNPEVVFASRDDELKAGKQASELVAQQMGLMPDAPRTRYVKDLGASLAIHSPRQDIPYEFHIIDMKDPNAFALPGGYVYVSRGLMLLANDEAALAGAIGHEIGHAAARHSVQRQTRSAPLAILTGVTAGVVGLVSPALGRGVGSVAGLGGQPAFRFFREHGEDRFCGGRNVQLAEPPSGSRMHLGTRAAVQDQQPVDDRFVIQGDQQVNRLLLTAPSFPREHRSPLSDHQVVKRFDVGQFHERFADSLSEFGIGIVQQFTQQGDVLRRWSVGDGSQCLCDHLPNVDVRRLECLLDQRHDQLWINAKHLTKRNRLYRRHRVDR